MIFWIVVFLITVVVLALGAFLALVALVWMLPDMSPDEPTESGERPL